MTRVLIVDDNEESLYYLRVLLSGAGFVVESARHGAEALVKARQVAPDLVVSDLLMPEMDGYTLLRNWKLDPRLRTIPFVVYTATYAEPEDERLAFNFGADAYILKPAEPDSFLQKIREVHTSGARVPPAVPNKPTLLKIYSEVLIRKLEEKSLRLEKTNRELQQEVAEYRQAEAVTKHLGDRTQLHKQRVFKTTVTTHEIVDNLLNGLRLVRLQAKEPLTGEMLKLVDQLVAEAALKLDALQNPETVAEDGMATGPGDVF